MRINYRAYVTDMMKLIHHPDPLGASRRIYALEKKLAEAHEFHDPEATVEESITAMSIDGLQAYAPAIDWRRLFKAMHYEMAKSIVISDGQAIANSVALVDTVPVEDWKDWFAFHSCQRLRALPAEGVRRPAVRLHVAAPLRHREAAGALALRRAASQRLSRRRHRRTLCRRALPARAQAAGGGDVRQRRRAFAARLGKLDWMDAETRAEAHAKLDSSSPRSAMPRTRRTIPGRSSSATSSSRTCSPPTTSTTA